MRPKKEGRPGETKGGMNLAKTACGALSSAIGVESENGGKPAATMNLLWQIGANSLGVK